MTEIYLIKDTGISPGNYMYWASKEECDNWFNNKSFKTLTDYSYVRNGPNSMNGYNVGCVHVELPYSEVTMCDYLAYKNEEFEDRWFYAQVVNIEYVNKDSTRLYFVLDYVASYYDTISLGKCFVERTHVGDDWKSKGSESASKYLLPEPFAVNIQNRPDLLLDDPFREANDRLYLNTSKFNLITTISDDGKINNPEIKYQAGGALSGYLYTGTQSEIEEKLTKYVTFSSQLVVRAESILNHVSSIYIAPEEVTDDETNTPLYEEIDRAFNTIIAPVLPDEEDNNGVRHAKVFDYFRIRVIGNTNEIILSPAEYGSRVWGQIVKTGGPFGRFTFLFNDPEGNRTGAYVATAPWPTVSVSATVNAFEYKVNPTIMGKLAAASDVSEGLKIMGDRDGAVLRSIL